MANHKIKKIMSLIIEYTFIIYKQKIKFIDSLYLCSTSFQTKLMMQKKGAINQAPPPELLFNNFRNSHKEQISPTHWSNNQLILV